MAWVANLFTLSGAPAVGIGSLAFPYNHFVYLPNMTSTHLWVMASLVLVLVFGLLAILLSGFGTTTYETLVRARRYLDETDAIPWAWQVQRSTFYCVRAGIKAAAVERGREDVLIPVIRNTWTGPIRR